MSNKYNKVHWTKKNNLGVLHNGKQTQPCKNTMAKQDFCGTEDLQK